MNRPGTFERVYSAIKEQLRGGLFRPGERLEPTVLSYELNSSVTPVRDALHRLTGERLVETPRHEGFRAPAMTEVALRHLYAWHQDLLLVALLHSRTLPGPVEIAGCEPFDQERSLRRLFLAIAQGSGNPEHLVAFESAAERLRPIGRLEPLVIKDIDEERSEFQSALEAGGKAVRWAIIRYHRRRTRAVPELLERLMQDEAPTIGLPGSN
jgi:hypothetical protein